MNYKILVTGSEGSLGQAIIPLLIQYGFEVVGADSYFKYAYMDGMELPPDRMDYLFYEGDLTSEDFVDTIFRSHEFYGVIQCAAKIFGIAGFNAHGADILGDDLTLHTNLLKAATKQPSMQRFVYISSSMVYEKSFKIPSEESHTEDIIVPATDYGLSKLVGERLTMAYAQQHGPFDYTIWRPFNIITPYEAAHREMGHSHVFADFIDQIVEKKCDFLPMFGNGQQVRCFTWIDDIAQAIATYSFDARARNRIFNIGNPEPITMSGLANLIYHTAKSMGLPVGGKNGDLQFEMKREFPHDVKIRIPDITAVKETFGWEPTVHLQESVERCLRHFTK